MFTIMGADVLNVIKVKIDWDRESQRDRDEYKVWEQKMEVEKINWEKQSEWTRNVASDGEKKKNSNRMKRDKKYVEKA